MEKNNYGMDGPKSRREFEHNIFLLIDNANRILNNNNNEDQINNFLWATYPHLIKIKNHSNKRVNLMTINEQARLQANMRKWFEKQ